MIKFCYSIFNLKNSWRKNFSTAYDLNILTVWKWIKIYLLIQGSVIKIKVASSGTRVHVSLTEFRFAAKCLFLPTLLVLVRYDYIYSSVFVTFQFQDEINRECITIYMRWLCTWQCTVKSTMETGVNRQLSRYLTYHKDLVTYLVFDWSLVTVLILLSFVWLTDSYFPHLGSIPKRYNQVAF